MQRGYDSLARVVKVATNPQLIGLHFASDPNQPASHFGGIELSQNGAMVAGLGSEHHLRSSAASRWGDVCLTRDDLIAAAQTRTDFLAPSADAN
jgi:hypothetical protein